MQSTIKVDVSKSAVTFTGTPSYIPLLQVHAAADLAEKAPGAATADFNFEQYMYKRGKMINQALDKALPMAYPPDVIESMR